MSDSPVPDQNLTSENQAVTTPTGPAPEPSFDAKFIESIRTYFPIEVIKLNFRVTPKGLFVSHGFRDQLVDAYQKWLESLGLPLAARTINKIQRRIFAGDEPPLYYLVEGKLSLSGYLAVATIQQPQRYQIPYFLGSMADSRTELNPQDPIFSSMQGLSAAQSPTGLKVIVKLNDQEVIVTKDAIKEFLAKAEHSPRTLKEFPRLNETQPESLRALVTLLQKSRSPHNAKDPRLLPIKLVSQKKLVVRTVGSYEFIINSQRELIAVLDLKGKNLSHFVAREMAAIRQKGERRIGIFDLASERDRHLGVFNLRGKKFRLATHALAGFVEHVADSPEKRDRFLQDYTVRDCFEKFSVLYQTAQPIDGKLIATFVGDFKQRGTRFFVNGAWIFVLSPDGMISHCLARHARPREKRERR